MKITSENSEVLNSYGLAVIADRRAGRRQSHSVVSSRRQSLSVVIGRQQCHDVYFSNSPRENDRRQSARGVVFSFPSFFLYLPRGEQPGAV